MEHGIEGLTLAAGVVLFVAALTLFSVVKGDVSAMSMALREAAARDEVLQTYVVEEVP